MGYLGEERRRAEERATDHIAGDRREAGREQRVERELAQDDLEPEEQPGDRRVESRGDPARGAARDDDPQPVLRHPHELAERRRQRRSDLDDRAFASHRPTSADADRRGERLDDRHLWADPPAVLGDREHHLRHPVTTGLPREALDQRPVQQAAHDRDHEHEEDPQRTEGAGSARGLAGRTAYSRSPAM